MASRGDIQAGAAFIRLFLKDDLTRDLQKKLKQVGSTLKTVGADVRRIGLGVAAAGGAVVGAMAGAVNHFVKVGKELGDTKAIKLAESFDDLKKSVSSLGYEIGSALAEPLMQFAKIAKDVIVVVTQWVRDNKALVVILAGAAVAVTAFGIAIVALGSAITAVGLIFTAVSSAIAFLMTPLGAVLAVIGLVTAALAAGVIWWAKFTESGKATMKILGAVFGGIFDALKAGKWQLAGDIAMAALKLAWVKGTNAIEKIWTDMVLGIKAIWFAAIDDIIKGWNEAFGTDIALPGRSLDADRAAGNAARDKRAADAKKNLDALIASAGALGGAGGGVGPGFGAVVQAARRKEFNALTDNRQNIITNSGAAAAAAGYQGGIFRMNSREKEHERKLIKHLEEAEKDRKKMMRAIDKISEGLAYR